MNCSRRGLWCAVLALLALGESAGAQEAELQAGVGARVAVLLEQGRGRLYPAEARLAGMWMKGPAVVVRLELPESFLYGGGITDQSLEEMSRELVEGLSGFPELAE